MTVQEVIRELQNIKNYATASALPALDYAIAVLTEKAGDAGAEDKND